MLFTGIYTVKYYNMHKITIFTWLVWNLEWSWCSSHSGVSDTFGKFLF